MGFKRVKQEPKSISLTYWVVEPPDLSPEMIQKSSTIKLHDQKCQTSLCQICCSIKCDLKRYIQSLAKCKSLSFFAKDTVFVTKLNNIKLFAFLKGKKVSLCSQVQWSKFGIYLKNGFGVRASKKMFTVLLYMGRIAVKNLPLHSS